MHHHREMPEWERFGAKTAAVGGGAALFALPMLLVSACVSFMVGLMVGKMCGKMCMTYSMKPPWAYKMGMGGHHHGMTGMSEHHHHGYGQPPCWSMHEKHHFGKPAGDEQHPTGM